MECIYAYNNEIVFNFISKYFYKKVFFVHVHTKEMKTRQLNFTFPILVKRNNVISTFINIVEDVNNKIQLDIYTVFYNEIFEANYGKHVLPCFFPLFISFLFIRPVIAHRRDDDEHMTRKPRIVLA